ncbi:hypothetical protein EFE11_10925 [Corynebacterium diphtheriae]|nr:hypothetical protein EFE11_10925 [Corynebacterium diphtheriae]
MQCGAVSNFCFNNFRICRISAGRRYKKLPKCTKIAHFLARNGRTSSGDCCGNMCPSFHK